MLRSALKEDDFIATEGAGLKEMILGQGSKLGVAVQMRNDVKERW